MEASEKLKIKMQYDDTLFFVYKNVVFTAHAECS